YIRLYISLYLYVSISLSLFISYSSFNADLPFFPTRRSSDLCKRDLYSLFSRNRFKVVATLFFLLMIFSALTSFSLFSLKNFISRSEEHTSELQSRFDLVCRLLL